MASGHSEMYAAVSFIIGRVTTVRMQHDGKERIFEAGGSVMHPANIYLKRWLKEFGK